MSENCLPVNDVSTSLAILAPREELFDGLASYTFMVKTGMKKTN